MKLTCREASRLLSQGLDRELTLAQRAQLKLHLTVCDACTRVKAQFQFLRRALSAYSAGGADADEAAKRKPPH
jgi:anti-sigma factor RsiW